MEYQRSVEVGVAVGDLWRWHLRPGAFARLAPPWQRMELPAATPPLASGLELEFKLRAGPLRIPWRAAIRELSPEAFFEDVQLRGPFRRWRHRHGFAALGQRRSRLTDQLEYSLPVGLERWPFVGGLAARQAGSQLERLFAFRHARMKADLERWCDRLPERPGTVLISGGNGLIGQRLRALLLTLGYAVRVLTRRPRCEGEFGWDIGGGWLDPAALEGVDAIIHLAGENIAGGRWTPARKQRILSSRVEGTRVLVAAIQAARERPQVLLSASGINYYGSDGQIHDEQSPCGSGFLSTVCAAWEAEAMKAEQLGLRVVCMRTGVVLDPLGGALGKMLPAFRAGLGGRIGHGRQPFPWISMDDLLDLYVEALSDVRWRGPVNAVAPEILSNAHFARTLAAVLRRPCALPLPEPLVALLFGEMGREALLAGVGAAPAAALQKGYRFRHASLEACLRFMLRPETAAAAPV